MFRLLTVSALVIMVGCISNVSAYADTFNRIGILKCDSSRNSFIVRFGIVYNEDPIDQAELSEIPDSVAKNWRSLPLQNSQSCQLSDGKKIFLSTKNKQAYAYGAGGGDPSATFILEKNDKNIYYSKTFYAGYGAGRYLVNAITYENGQLKACSFYEKNIESCLSQGKGLNWCTYNAEKSTSIECNDVSSRLAGDALSDEERSEFQREKERLSLQDNLSPLCKELRAHAPSHKNDTYEYIGKISGGHLSVMSIDINNDGKVDKVFRVGGSSADCVSCGTHYFDGSYLVAFNGSQQKIPDFLSSLNKKEYEIDREPNIKYLPEWDAHFISLGMAGSSARYVYNVPFVYKEDSYIYSFETNIEKTPSSSISKITPDNHVENVCKFP